MLPRALVSPRAGRSGPRGQAVPPWRRWRILPLLSLFSVDLAQAQVPPAGSTPGPQAAVMPPSMPVTTLPSPAGSARPPSGPVPDFPFVDRLIDENVADEAGADAGPLPEEPAGFRATVFEPRMYLRRSSLSGPYDEAGLYFQHRRETVNWGDLIFEAAMRSADQDTLFALAQARTSSRLTLRQVGMPLADGAALTNAAGLFRTMPGEALRSGFRFNLPGALISGIASYRTTDTGSVQVEHGGLVQLEGLQGLGTRRLDARATAVGASQVVDEDWSVGVQALNVRSTLDAGDYSAWTGALNYGDVGADLRWRAQMLRDNRGRGGQWLEGEWKTGYQTLRGGAWKFDPSIYWFSTLLSSGQLGGALRYDYSDRTLFWGAGVEGTRNDAFDPLRAPIDASLVSVSGGYRFDRQRTVGVVGQLRRAAPRFDDGLSMQSRYASMAVYGARNSESRTDRIQYALVESSGVGDSRVHELTWTRDLMQGDDSAVGMTVGFAHETTPDRTRLRPAVGASYSGPLSRGRLAAWVRYARDSERFSSSYSLSGTTQVTWPLTNEWSATMSANLNRMGFDTQQAFFGALPVKVNERSVWLTVRYAISGGRPYLLDQPGEGRGAGTIAGVVYFDEDRDGLRSSGEKAAAGVTVWLDNVLSATTAADGSFEFPAVRSGRHTVRVDNATVRLPWGAAEDRGRPVTVEVRDRARVDLPLIRIGE